MRLKPSGGRKPTAISPGCCHPRPAAPQLSGLVSLKESLPTQHCFAAPAHFSALLSPPTPSRTAPPPPASTPPTGLRSRESAASIRTRTPLQGHPTCPADTPAA